MKFLFEFTAIFIVSVLHHVLGAFSNDKDSGRTSQVSVLEQLLRRWAGAMSGIAVVLLVATNKINGLHLIGVHPEEGKDNGYAVLAGLAAVFIFIFALSLIRKFFPGIRKQASLPLDTTRLWIAEAIRYRGWRERLAYLTTLPLDVLSESLVYRGYLILFLGNKTGVYFPWVVVSIMLSTAIHLYQGRDLKTILTRLIAAGFLAGLTLMTGNILTPITAHLYYDFIITIQAWRLVKENEEISSGMTYSGKEKIAYAAFIIFNIAFLYVSMMSALGWL